MKIGSMKDAVIEVIKNYPSGHRYHGNQLHDAVVLLYPKATRMYTDTIQRAMRRYCHSQYKTINQNKSLYEKV